MHAIIVAGGYGTRLGDLVLNQSKCLLKVNEKSIITYIVEKLEKFDRIDEVHVVTNEKFHEHFLDWHAHLETSLKITIYNDKTLSNEDRLGTVGDLDFVIQEAQIDDDVVIIAGDNLFESDLSEMFECFDAKGNTIGLYDVGSLELAKLFGNVTIDEDERITKFVEKPENPTSSYSATLIYVLKKDALPYMRGAIEAGYQDRAGDFIKYLVDREEVYGRPINGAWFDIGTPEQLTEAEESFRQ